MKFRRMLAAILSALMVMSAFAFTAWAQDEENADAELMATGIVKEITSAARGGDSSNTCKKYYDAVNDVLFSRIATAPGKTASSLHWDCYNFGDMTVDPDDGQLYASYRMRALKPGAVPRPRTKNNAGSWIYHTGTAITGDGNWETATVAMNLTAGDTIKQIHTHLLGTKSSTTPHTADTYFDVAIAVYANDEASAVEAANTASKYASEYDIKFNLNYEGTEDLDTYPTEIPDRTDDGFVFEGWATKAEATEAEVEYTDLTCVAVPTANTTYYAVWGDLIEAENAVYISADGDDANGGRHSEDAVATLAKAEAILEAEGNESLNTIYIVGAPEITSGSVTFGIPDKKVYINGYTGNSDVFDITAGHIRFNGDAEFNNITIAQVTGPDWSDGGFMAQGHNITIGENVIVTGIKHASQYYYNASGEHYTGNSASNPADSVINVNSGSWTSVHPGTYTAGPSFYGKSTVNIGGNASVSSVRFGHNSNVGFYGTFAVNINGGNVTNIYMNYNKQVNSYNGVRYFTINDGTVGNVYITPKVTGDTQTGVTVVEVNKAGVLTGKIAQGGVDDAAQRIVIYNNGSYVAGQVTDTAATVIASTEGTIHADVTVASDYTATLNGYTYTTDSTNKYININGTNYSLADFTNVDATLAEETTVLIPADLFAAGENTAVFSETPLYEIKWVNGEEVVKTETIDGGTTPTAPTLTKTGYNLSWSPEVSEASADITYTAVWTANEYDVVFDAGDGTFADGKNTTIVKATFDSAITAPTEVPTKEGYTFAGWTPEVGTLTTEGATFTATWTLNNYTITFNAGEGKFSDGESTKTVTADHGTTPEFDEIPVLDGYTFKEWTPAIAEATGIATYTATYEKNFATAPTYNTYGYYDALNGTYKVELRFSGAKVNQGSFGFNFPTSQMTFKSVAANAEAGIEFLGDISPIYASGEGYYANTWAVGSVENAGHIDATTKEVLVATFEFSMTEEQRTAFVNAGTKLDEYEAVTANKYYDGTNYIATIHAGDFSFDRQAIVYDSHTDEEVTTKAFYTTYGTYDSLREEYTIDIKVEGAKINLGAFGLAFNAEHMTFDPSADENGNAVNVTMAEGVANYLGIVLNNTANGYAFVFDGSESSEGYIDAVDGEVLIATIKTKMTAAQRSAFEEAGKIMSVFVPTANDNITAEELAEYYNGENYLVSLYTNGLDIPRIPAIYEAHNDKVLEVTEAHVEVTVNFTAKSEEGTTKANLGYLSLGGAEIVIDAAGSTAASATHKYEFLKIGETYAIKVVKNGYLTTEMEYTVVEGDNKIEIDLIAGDIKGAADDRCGDGKIDLSDFVRLIRAFDENAGDDFIATVDLDENGSVNVADLAIIKANYNKTSADNKVTVNG